jgi:hypothetical protein
VNRWQLWRAWAFSISVLMSVVAFGAIPFYEHWFSRLGYAALASDTLRVWLDWMICASLIALFGSLFGRGWRRITVCLLSIAELYYWFVLSIAV